MEPLFFMHIGKTAGSYLKQCLVETFGADKVLEFCDRLIGPFYEERHGSRFEGKAVISGHVYIADWLDFCRVRGVETKAATVLRSPLGLIVSSLRFFDSFNYPEKFAERDRLDAETRKLISRIAAVDFSDPGSIDRFLTTLSPFDMIIFDNPQSRYFLAKSWGDVGDRIRYFDPVSLDMAPRVIDGFGQFSVIGLTERLPETLALLSRVVGRPIRPISSRVNESISPRTIDLEDEWIRAVLRKRIIVDEWIYRQAVHRFEEDLDRVSGDTCLA